MALRAVEPSGLPGSASAVLTAGVSFLQPEEAVLEGMLAGWVAQQPSRLLAATTVENRGFAVRRLMAFTNEYPWAWTPVEVEEWTSSLVSAGLATPAGRVRGWRPWPRRPATPFGPPRSTNPTPSDVLAVVNEALLRRRDDGDPCSALPSMAASAPIGADCA